jgi:phosphomevalonate kinase
MRLTAGEASAPGKVVLGGEYAVLHGAPAIAMAVDRRARVEIRELAGSDHELLLPGFAEGCFRFRAGGNGAIDWLDAAPAANAFRLFECVWQEAAPDPASGLRITLDTRDFADPARGQKLGLGSSAALAVAFSALLQPRDRVAQAALQAHRRFQDGSGSGVDIAVAAHGGLLEFCNGDLKNTENRRWPAGLCLRLFWSGTPVSTPARIRQLEKQLSDPARQPSLAALCAASVELAASWAAADAAGVLAQYLTYNAALRAFDCDQALGIYHGGHEDMHGLARCHDVVYKPCGAGGGDIGAALALDAGALARFASAARRLGFAELDARLDCRGFTANGRQV